MTAARFALLALVFTTAQSSPAPDPFEGIPNVQFNYYDVSGDTPAAVRRDMNTKQIIDPNDGKPMDAMARWRFNWRWRNNGEGKCDLSTIQISFGGTVTMPRLANEETASKSLRERWQRYMRALREHEAGHIRYAWEHRSDLEAALKGATCETVNEAGRVAIAKIGEHDVAYDAQTRHGATQGATFP